MSDFVLSRWWYVLFFLSGAVFLPLGSGQEIHDTTYVIGVLESAGSGGGDRYRLPRIHANVRLANGRLVTMTLPRHTPPLAGAEVRVRVTTLVSKRVRYSFAGYSSDRGGGNERPPRR